MTYKWICAALSLVLLGCSGDSHKHHDSQQAALSRMLYSPNGEPLNGGPLGRPTCADAMSHWFDRVDANHDGVISRDEFMADAKLQFSRMDLDKNGYLVSEEVERFRRPYRQQPASEQPAAKQNTGAGDAKQSKHRHGATSGAPDDSGTESRQENTPVDTADPVMSADTNLDFKVTPEEFMIHVQKIFAELDGNHDGTLTRDEAAAHCPKP